MKKNIILLGTLVISSIAYSQVGINNTAPQATLDITAKNTDGSTAEGIIAPRLTGDQIQSGDTQYTSAQMGTIVYATSAVTTPSTKTSNITTGGYYYFDGSIWQKFTGATSAGNFWSLTGNAGTIPGTNFLGTTDAQNLIFKVNGLESGRITYDAYSGNPPGTGGQTSFGYLAANNNTGNRVTAIGDRALINNQGIKNTGIGFWALILNSTGANNTALGSGALSVNTTGSDNVGIGNVTLQNLPLGSRNTAVGSSAASLLSGGNDNTFIGYSAGSTGFNSSEKNTLIGSFSKLSTGGLTNATAIGYNAAVAQNNSLILGGTGTEAVSVGIGTTTPSNTLHIVATANPVRFEGLQAGAATDNIVVASSTGVLKTVNPSIFAADLRVVGTRNHVTQDAGVGNNGTSVGTGTDNIAIGANTLSANTTGNYNTAIGTNALKSNTIGTYNIATGYNSLTANTTGNGNIAYGSQVLSANISGNNNVAFGAATLQLNTTGSQNVAIGDGSLQNSTGSYNAALGSGALKTSTTGNYNTASGFNALGSVTTGSYNVGLGINAANNLTTGSFNVVVGVGTVNDPAADNQINIGDAIWGTNKNIGLSDAAFAPAERLDVAKGNVRVRDINTVTGLSTDKVVVADTNGVLKTVTAASVASSLEPWQVQGGTTAATTNAQNIYQTGNVSIGLNSINPIAPFTSNGVTVTPTLSVKGDVASTGAFYTATGKYADYVFEDYFDGTSKIDDTYKFKSLDEVAAYIKANKHLPGVTSIKDLPKTENGYTVNLSDLSIQQLEKIEELYLHSIEQQDEIAKQKTEINDLKSRMEKLEQLVLKTTNNK